MITEKSQIRGWGKRKESWTLQTIEWKQKESRVSAFIQETFMHTSYVWGIGDS